MQKALEPAHPILLLRDTREKRSVFVWDSNFRDSTKIGKRS